MFIYVPKKIQSFSVISAIVLCLSLIPLTGSTADSNLEARVKQLELALKATQQQRDEQNRQIELLTKSLQDISAQIAQPKSVKSEEIVSSKSKPVLASLKDGLIFADETGDWSLQLNGRIQTDYRNVNPNEWKNDTFDIRRARLGGTFTFLKDFAVRVEGEYANTNDGSKSTTALTYGYLEWKHFSGAKLRVGQFKPVFGLERGISSNFTDFQEASLATGNGPSFNSTYDRGVMLFGAPFKGAYYNLSYINGSGQNNDAMMNDKDIIGRVAINVASYTNWQDSVLHVGVSGSQNTVQKSSASAGGNDSALSAYTEANGIASNAIGYSNTTATKFFSTSAFNDSNVDKSRLGFETALAYGPVKLQGEYVHTNFGGTTLAGVDFSKDINAWYASATWLLTGESYASSYKDAMFGRIIPKHNLSFGKDGYGAFELGVRYSSFDASDFKLTGCITGSGCLASTSVTNQANAWTGGAKWILNPNARILLNYVHTNFDTPVIINAQSSNKEEAITMRAQYDF